MKRIQVDFTGEFSILRLYITPISSRYAVTVTCVPIGGNDEHPDNMIVGRDSVTKGEMVKAIEQLLDEVRGL